MAPTTSRPWPPPSTADRARRSVGERLPRLSTPCCDPVRLVLRRPIESGQYAAEPYRQVLERHGITQNLFESAYCAGARIGIGLSSASKPERTPTKARRAAETSSRPARS